MFRCLSGGSSGAPVDHVSTSFRSGQRCSDGYTGAFSLNHRTFRCLGLAGPLVLFSLNSFAGPTRQSHHCFSSSSRNRRPTPAPVSRSAAATPAPPLRYSKRAAPALLRRRATRLHLRTRRACARATLRRPALPCAARTARRRLPRAAPPLRSTSSRAFLCSFALLEPQQGLCPTPYTP